MVLTQGPRLVRGVSIGRRGVDVGDSNARWKLGTIMHATSQSSKTFSSSAVAHLALVWALGPHAPCLRNRQRQTLVNNGHCLARSVQHIFSGIIRNNQHSLVNIAHCFRYHTLNSIQRLDSRARPTSRLILSTGSNAEAPHLALSVAL